MNPHTTDRVIGLDCESNGLHGQIFAIGISIQTRDRGETFAAQWRCPILGAVDPWVAEHVLPILDHPLMGIREDSSLTESDLGAQWREVYDPLKAEGYQVVTHIAWPVEARFLWSAHAADPFSGPFPLRDVAGNLEQAGWDPESLDSYLTATANERYGRPHHPVYDARSVVHAYFQLTA